MKLLILILTIIGLNFSYSYQRIEQKPQGKIEYINPSLNKDTRWIKESGTLIWTNELAAEYREKATIIFIQKGKYIKIFNGSTKVIRIGNMGTWRYERDSQK
jgi:aspartate aminotransferase-like enzyme